jgi:CRP-like cAMP-binding protein
VLFSEGDEAHEVIVLLEGSIKVVSTTSAGRELILDVLDEGALVGELSAIDGEPRSATGIALTPVGVLVLHTERFSAFLEEHGSVATALLRLMVGRLRRSSQRQFEFGTGDARAIGGDGCVLALLDQTPPTTAPRGSPRAARDRVDDRGSPGGRRQGARALRSWAGSICGSGVTVLDEAAIGRRDPDGRPSMDP